MGTGDEIEPKGHYLAHEVGWLAGVSGDRIGQWARYGYIRSSQSSTVPRVYSYQDVAEAMVVHELVEGSVPLKFIKLAINQLRATYGNWPLQEADLAVAPDSSRSPVIVVEAERGFDLSKNWQGVLTTRNLRRVARDLRRGGWAAREIPSLKHIEVNPDRLSGRPTIKGLRVPAEMVGELAQTAEGRIVLKRDYELSEAQIRDATQWWRTVSEYDLAA